MKVDVIFGSTGDYFQYLLLPGNVLLNHFVTFILEHAVDLLKWPIN